MNKLKSRFAEQKIDFVVYSGWTELYWAVRVWRRPWILN